MRFHTTRIKHRSKNLTLKTACDPWSGSPEKHIGEQQKNARRREMSRQQNLFFKEILTVCTKLSNGIVLWKSSPARLGLSGVQWADAHLVEFEEIMKMVGMVRQG
jgi:hypothetical protein